MWRLLSWSWGSAAGCSWSGQGRNQAQLPSSTSSLVNTCLHSAVEVWLHSMAELSIAFMSRSRSPYFLICVCYLSFEWPNRLFSTAVATSQSHWVSHFFDNFTAANHDNNDVANLLSDLKSYCLRPAYVGHPPYLVSFPSTALDLLSRTGRCCSSQQLSHLPRWLQLRLSHLAPLENLQYLDNWFLYYNSIHMLPSLWLDLWFSGQLPLIYLHL